MRNGFPGFVGAPEVGLKRAGPLEVELDIIFLGDAHTAVQLNARAGDKKSGVARALESYLGRPDESREAIAQLLLDEPASKGAPRAA